MKSKTELDAPGSKVETSASRASTCISARMPGRPSWSETKFAIGIMKFECWASLRFNWRREPAENHRFLRTGDMRRRTGLASPATPARTPLRGEALERVDEALHAGPTAHDRQARG